MDEREKEMMIMKIALIIITTKKNILDYKFCVYKNALAVGQERNNKLLTGLDCFS